MYQYPSIQGPNKAPHEHCIAFEKIDGSNLRWEWSPKRGWSKFGTRTHLFDATDKVFGAAIQVFLDKYADPLERVIRDTKEFRCVDRVTAFTEFFGPNSFAGVHVPNDPKDLILFDVHVYKKGILGPRDFLKYFGHLPVAKVIYEGVLNQTLVEDVRQGKYPVVEGVVCKGGSGHGLWMRKIKTLAYLERLKNRFPGDWTKLWE